jgi:ribosomal protein S18 acetylase RimI-like enzyme
MTTTTDIANRALQLIGTRTTIASLGEASNEAIQANLSYAPVTDWCHGAANWNFARKTAALTLQKTVQLPPSAWSSTSPSPPWLNEFILPTDFIQARYLTNSAAAQTTNYDGEPKRFAIADDYVSSAETKVLLTNETNAVLVYTGRIIDPTAWPWYFERFAVTALAWTLALALTGDKVLLEALDNTLMRFFIIAEEANRKEGLLPEDTTPEWIQALGITYPLRRFQQPQQFQPQQQRRQGNDNQR